MRETKYDLFDYQTCNETEALKRCKVYVVKRNYKGFYFYDLAFEFDNFVFVMQPRDFYSSKTNQLYRRLMYHLGNSESVQK